MQHSPPFPYQYDSMDLILSSFVLIIQKLAINLQMMMLATDTGWLLFLQHLTFTWKVFLDRSGAQIFFHYYLIIICFRFNCVNGRFHPTQSTTLLMYNKHGCPVSLFCLLGLDVMCYRIGFQLDQFPNYHNGFACDAMC